MVHVILSASYFNLGSSRCSMLYSICSSKRESRRAWQQQRRRRRRRRKEAANWLYLWQLHQDKWQNKHCTDLICSSRSVGRPSEPASVFAADPRNDGSQRADRLHHWQGWLQDCRDQVSCLYTYLLNPWPDFNDSSSHSLLRMLEDDIN